MIDEKVIGNLCLVINDYTKRNLKPDIARKKINGIFHNKSIKNIFKELNGYLKDKSGNQKNILVLLIVMSLLCRNLDCVEEIKTCIQKYKLTGGLYGGLYVLLSGKSEKVMLTVKLNHEQYKNKYEYLHCFYDLHYWEFALLFQTAKTLNLLDRDKFEKLALFDKSRLLLLNMATNYLDIEPSDNLVRKLLSNDDELKQNIGLCFITSRLSGKFDEFCYIKRCIKEGLPTMKDIKEVENILCVEIQKFFVYIETCNKKTQASLLFNYVLVHQNQYPNIFAKKLVSSNLQEEFVNQIRESGKIRGLKDVFCLTKLISETPALNEENKRISKSDLYLAITDLIITLLEERRIYIWEKQEIDCMKYICKQLPQKCIRKLRLYLTSKRKTLMCERIDELVRYKLYLKDKKMADIIDGILGMTNR